MPTNWMPLGGGSPEPVGLAPAERRQLGVQLNRAILDRVRNRIVAAFRRSP